MNIKITSDSTCDLSHELISRYNISIIPLCIIKDGKSYKDQIEITPKDIFDYTSSGKGTCTTSAINVAEYSNFFSSFLNEYDAVIHISLSSKISACHQNAKLAANELKNVYVIDSLSLSSGSGIITLKAAMLAESGIPADKICENLYDLAQHVDASFVIDTLEYLRKGGRCSSLVELGANLLKIKPCIEVKNGKMGVGKKYRGLLDKCLEQYVTDRLKNADDIVYDLIFITHSGCNKEIIDMVRNLINKYGKFNEIIETTAGCTISNHCGPNTLGILFVRK
jgi:DegV family protein with EDD domain